MKYGSAVWLSCSRPGTFPSLSLTVATSVTAVTSAGTDEGVGTSDMTRVPTTGATTGTSATFVSAPPFAAVAVTVASPQQAPLESLLAHSLHW